MEVVRLLPEHGLGGGGERGWLSIATHCTVMMVFFMPELCW